MFYLPNHPVDDSTCNDDGLHLLSFASSLKLRNFFPADVNGKALGTLFPGNVVLDYLFCYFDFSCQIIRFLELWSDHFALAAVMRSGLGENCSSVSDYVRINDFVRPYFFLEVDSADHSALTEVIQNGSNDVDEVWNEALYTLF